DQKLSLFTIQDAERIALDCYGLQVEACPLPGERDTNFHLSESMGQEFVLKIAPVGEQRETLDLQNQALAYLAEHDPALVLPRIRATPGGETIATITGGNGAEHFVRLLTYIPGKLFAVTAPLPAGSSARALLARSGRPVPAANLPLPPPMRCWGRQVPCRLPPQSSMATTRHSQFLRPNRTCFINCSVWECASMWSTRRTS